MKQNQVDKYLKMKKPKGFRTSSVSFWAVAVVQYSVKLSHLKDA